MPLPLCEVTGKRQPLKRQLGFPGDAVVKNTPAKAGDTRAGSLGQEDPLEEGMATHSGILAWRISWTEDPGRLQSLESQRVGDY